MDKTNIKTSLQPGRSRAIANNIRAKKDKRPGHTGIPFIQTKLRIGQPGDVYEQEADRVAASVMRRESDELQRQPMEEEEEMLQAKGENPSGSRNGDPFIEERVNSLNDGGFSLPEGIRNFMEERFGFDFGGVNLHNDSRSNALAGDLNARAFTYGNNITFGAGQYDPGSSSGKELLAHELTHVVQQNSDKLQKKPVEKSPSKHKIRKRPTLSLLRMNNDRVIQRETVSEFYGNMWEAYVYPGKAANKGTSVNEVTKKRGKRARNFQRFEGRNVIEEGGKKVIPIGSAKFDIKEKTKSFGDTTSVSDTSFDESTPAEWDIVQEKYMLFDPSPAPLDLQQGELGDCWLLATLQSISRTPEGKAHLMNIIKEDGNDKYSVEFFRLKISNGEAIPDPDTKIRVSVSMKKNDKASHFRRKGDFPMTAADLSKVKEMHPEIKAGDHVSGNYYKNITWAWAAEKAYAQVAGSYKILEGGLAGMPMMVILGRLARFKGKLNELSEADTGMLFNNMKFELNHKKNLTLQTLNEEELIKQKYSNKVNIQSANSSGIKINTDKDSSLSDTLPWPFFYKHFFSYKIIDQIQSIFGQEGAERSSKSIDDHEEELKKAAKNFWVTIPAVLEKGRFYHNKRFVVPAHVYSLQNARAGRADIYNPWGDLHLKNMVPAEFRIIFEHLFVSS